MSLEKYLITYEIKDKTRDLSGFYNAIKSLGAWWHYMDSIWIIKNSTYTPQYIYNILVPYLYQNDYILIIKIDSTQKYGLLPHDAWIWLDT